MYVHFYRQLTFPVHGLEGSLLLPTRNSSGVERGLSVRAKKALWKLRAKRAGRPMTWATLDRSQKILADLSWLAGVDLEEFDQLNNCGPATIREIKIYATSLGMTL